MHGVGEVGGLVDEVHRRRITQTLGFPREGEKILS